MICPDCGNETVEYYQVGMPGVKAHVCEVCGLVKEADAKRDGSKCA